MSTGFTAGREGEFYDRQRKQYEQIDTHIRGTFRKIRVVNNCWDTVSPPLPLPGRVGRMENLPVVWSKTWGRR